MTEGAKVMRSTWDHARLCAVWEINGERYAADPHLKITVEADHRGMRFVTDGHEVVDRCDRCHRADYRPLVGYGPEDALAKRIFIPLAEYDAWHATRKDAGARLL